MYIVLPDEICPSYNNEINNKLHMLSKNPSEKQSMYPKTKNPRSKAPKLQM